MSAGFDRSRVPTWEAYADLVGLKLLGRGVWRTTRCDVHGGSDSLRVNTETGGWACMNCGARGGDTLAHHMAVTGADFITACKALHCWTENGNAPPAPARLSARDALAALTLELNVCVVVIADVRRGVVPNDIDWRRFLQAAGRVQFIAQEAQR
jgi:hypothetical protein